MSWTKRQFVLAAFEEVGYAAYNFDLQPEQQQSALQALDAMLALWNAKGIRLGYPLPSTPDSSDLDQITGVPDAANEAIYTNLAVRLGPRLGKVVSVELKMAAKDGLLALLARASVPMEQQLPANTPAGAGNKPWRGLRDPFLNPPVDPLTTGQDGELTFE